MKTKKWYLGTLKHGGESVFLEDFEWACGWYWSGGYIGNKNFHCHFDGCFLKVPDLRGHPLGGFITPWTLLPDYIKKENCKVIQNGAAVWEDLSFFLNNAQYNENEWRRIKDLFKQFYALTASAEVFQYGGHCTGDNRNPAELNKEMAAKINKHIETVIIPEIRKVLNKNL